MEQVNDVFLTKLWKAADALRGNISSEQYMHVVIGILFIKHMSDKYETALQSLKFDDPEYFEQFKDNRDVLAADYNLSFVIPAEASWDYIKQFTTSEKIGEVIDNAFILIESKNEELRGLFDKNYNREELDQNKLGLVVSEFSNLDLSAMGEDIIGRTYEYFLGEFFKKQGQKGGEFYTPASIVDLMVKIVEPLKGKLYDPTAGTGGMFVQARQHILKSGGNVDELVVYGQEYQNNTWKLSRINLLLHGFSVKNIHMGEKSADTFTNDLHKNEKFDYVLANPPFNVKNWSYEKLLDDPRFKELGMPPKGNANYAFLSHMIYKLKDNGVGATILANGSLSSSGKDELGIRKKMIEENYIEAIIALPDKLFFTTGIPACIWVFNKNKKRTNKKVLMINASNFEGEMLSKTVRKLTDLEIQKVVNVVKLSKNNEPISEVGFAKSVDKNELIANDYSFVPGRYVGVIEEKIDKEKAKQEIQTLGIELSKLMNQLKTVMPKVEDAIKKAIKFED